MLDWTICSHSSCSSCKQLDSWIEIAAAEWVEAITVQAHFRGVGPLESTRFWPRDRVWRSYDLV